MHVKNFYDSSHKSIYLTTLVAHLFDFIRYVWCHLDTGYMQGMCDLVAPLLVIIEDEALTYSCFCELMKRMASNFPQGGAMDNHFANMRYHELFFIRSNPR